MIDLTQLKENDVFMAFASYTTIVLSKMMFMSTATAFYRMTKKVFANPEDCAGFGKGENAKKYLRTDDRVERVRSSPTESTSLENALCQEYGSKIISGQGINMKTENSIRRKFVSVMMKKSKNQKR
ncbi:microsomal glutathione S-transferase 1 isoform X2 [Nycticebus coucang]|uniref:microsomal glutathione S-transferase 1 isoform X2 n=1 Tax=Nycticebus coucang TaxID=9470 RepID=UPI00234C8DC3|nr:microsomal glutathione S-transferase 1 isoform X2 [Nycticebus coucang]